MLSVCITHWSTVMSLLLVMSTLPPFLLLLPTVQSSMVVHDIVRRQMLQPSSNSSIITTNRELLGKSSLHPSPIWLSSNALLERIALPTGLLGSSPDPAFERCLNTIRTDPSDANLVYSTCFLSQIAWLVLLNATGVGEQEYRCKQLYCNSYCLNVAASAFCTGDYAIFKRTVKQVFDQEAPKCKQWANWVSPLDSPPAPPKTVIPDCTDAWNTKKPALEQCIAGAIDKLTQDEIPNRTEAQCKLEYEKQQCYTKFVCMSCVQYLGRESALEYLNFMAKLWSPTVVECTEWSHLAPQMECLDAEGEQCRSKVEIELVEELVAVSSIKPWIDLAQDQVERQCKQNYYIVRMLNLVACASCTSGQLGPYQAYLSQRLDSYHDDCALWRKWLPKIKCIADSVAHAIETNKCLVTLNKNNNANKTCTEGVKKVDDLKGKEKLCKSTYFLEKCFLVQMACKYCDNVDTVQQYVKQIWQPTEVECIEWVNDEPTYECSNTVWWIVGISVVSLVAILIVVAVIVICCCCCSDGDSGSSSSSRSRGHHRGHRGHGQYAGGSMQPMGTIQPMGNIQPMGTIQPMGNTQPMGVMQPIGTLQPIRA